MPTPGDTVCGGCLRKTPYFDATQACFRYAFPVDQLVQSLKYNHRLAVSAFLGEAMLEAAPRTMQADMILALPLAPQRLQERGFNQAIEIARPLARRLGLPLAITGYYRTLNNAPQASLPWKERQKNIRGAFECALDFSGKSLIVIDDVMTTGATLNEFARTLKNHGAAHVTNWVVARALKD
jgi:ComF family protein